MLKTAIVVLAAGKSTRMGSTKQLLNLFGKPMLVGILETVMRTNCYPIVAVLGANGIKISKEIEKLPITVIDNPSFESGMASSIVSGLIGAYMTSKEIDSIIFVTADQPQLTTEHIENIIQKAESTEKYIVASKFTGGFGIPALFKKPIFEEILDLKGENGAKKLIMKFKDSVEFVEFKDGNLDLDTMEDYKNYINLN